MDKLTQGIQKTIAVWKTCIFGLKRQCQKQNIKKKYNISCKKKKFENGNNNNNACETHAQFFFSLTMRMEIQSFWAVVVG